MKDILIKSYNRDAKNYDNKFKELQYAKYNLLFRNKNSIKTENKLKLGDFGCGTALFYDYLKNAGYDIEYFGVDLSESMVNIAKLKSDNILLSDINNTNYKANTFDIVTTFTVLRIIEDDEISILREIYRVLKPNGLLYISVLKNRVDQSLYNNFIETGFKLLEEINCGQDIGFIYKKVGDNSD